MDAKLVELLITALVGLASAWWGGHLGVRRALDKKKAERGFERRLEWYERAIVSLGELAVAQTHVAATARMGFSDEVLSSNIDAMLAKQPPVQRVFAEAGMYATRDGSRALSTMWADTLALPLMRPKNPSDISKGFDLNIEALERSVALMSEASVLLTLEMRSQAGYDHDDLRQPWWKRLRGSNARQISSPKAESAVRTDR